MWSEKLTMRKIAIVTIFSVNYGNRLQNYALQCVLEKLGYSVVTLRRDTKTKGLDQCIKTVIQYLLQTKGAKFKQFDRHIHFADETVTRDEYPVNIGSLYDYFIAGSDQIWNPHYDFVAGKCDFLAFAGDNQKISYAASFGVSEIPLERIDEYAEYLHAFKAISVREIQGSKIVKDLTDRKAAVVLDPVLLLNAVDWEKLQKTPKCMSKDCYVLVYAIGEKSEDFKKKIDEYKDTKVVFDIRTVQNNGKELPVGPAEFISLIHNADVILTDSFHATVLSILFHKKFITFKRPGIDMSSRITTLAKMMGINSYFDRGENLICDCELNYSSIDGRLDVKREQSVKFLKKALED